MRTSRRHSPKLPIKIIIAGMQVNQRTEIFDDTCFAAQRRDFALDLGRQFLQVLRQTCYRDTETEFVALVGEIRSKIRSCQTRSQTQPRSHMRFVHPRLQLLATRRRCRVTTSLGRSAFGLSL